MQVATTRKERIVTGRLMQPLFRSLLRSKWPMSSALVITCPKALALFDPALRALLLSSIAEATACGVMRPLGVSSAILSVFSTTVAGNGPSNLARAAPKLKTTSSCFLSAAPSWPRAWSPLCLPKKRSSICLTSKSCSTSHLLLLGADPPSAAAAGAPSAAPKGLGSTPRKVFGVGDDAWSEAWLLSTTLLVFFAVIASSRAIRSPHEVVHLEEEWRGEEDAVPPNRSSRQQLMTRTR
mmetsp:Transcript_58781/g.129040  ORF Transcript_58781/g.129040 Transcript_58781/m.129040 type:complete len:238 (-) Transcript_58781:320-1033(-)